MIAAAGEPQHVRQRRTFQKRMGIGGVLFLCSVLAAVAGVVCVVGSFVAFRTSGGKRIAAAVVGVASGVVAFGSILFIAVWVVNLFRGPTYSTSPEAFQDAFGIAPGSDVHDIQSHSSGSTDFAEQLLRFRCSAQTFDRIAQRFQPAAAVECQRGVRGSDVPAWWRAIDSSFTQCYTADPFDDSFATSRAWLSRQPSTGETRFYHQGVD
jgi:hypothetical protein